jgi:phage tail-like protein
MAIKGTPKKFIKKLKFRVIIDKLGSADFEKCSKLEAEIAKVERWQGGALVATKTPGRMTVSDIDLERGASKDRELLDWFESVVKAATNGGLVDGEYERTADIVALDRDNSELARWRCYESWPCKYSAADFDNTADEDAIEAVTLTMKYWERIA